MFLRPEGFRFVNADLIARTLPGKDPAEIAYQAAELAEIERRELIARGDTFVMETVFSDPHGAKLGLLRDARTVGYHIAFIYISLVDAALSCTRVSQRVALGGHDVPDAKIIARFPRTLTNAKAALSFVDAAWVFDNSNAEHPYRLVATVRDGHVVKLIEPVPEWCKSILPG